jgi:predicted metal-dependent enzyme (double-stranded beta helix superfamily)
MEISVSRDRLLMFAEDVAKTIRQSTDASPVAVRVRRLLREALQDTEFVLDCVDAATSAWTSSTSSSPWENPPIIDDDESAFSVRLIYWPARSRNSPHRHTYWTVTGVLLNQLTFVTYAEPPPGRAPTSLEHEFHGRAGDVGIIMPPCIHRVFNPSEAPSISVHVFSGPRAVGLPHPNRYERGLTTWFDEKVEGDADGPPLRTASDILAALIALLDKLTGPRVVPITDRLFGLADLPSKLACTKVLSRHDPRLAGQRLCELAAECGGPDGPKLRALAGRLGATPL